MASGCHKLTKWGMSHKAVLKNNSIQDICAKISEFIGQEEISNVHTTVKCILK